MTAKTFVYL